MKIQPATTLVSTTVALDLELSPQELLRLLPDLEDMAFVRAGSGIIGFGEALRLEASGPNRIGDLADAWREAVDASEIKNSLQWPGTGLVAFGSMAFADDSTAKSILVVPEWLLGCHDSKTWITRNTWAAADEAAIAATHANNAEGAAHWNEIFRTSDFGPVGEIVLHHGDITADNFEANVEKALQALQQGELQKVVLARDIVTELPSSFSLKRVLQNLGQKYPTCWIYSVDGTFGASPELLVRVSHGQVSARVLAGTAGRGTDPGIDQAIATALSSSAKNLAEHEFAVKSLVDSLQPFCNHVDADEKPFSLALPNLWHLASDVHGVLKSGSSALDVAAALHPTAAVAGTPRQAALNFIASVEATDRGRYAAPVGWISADGDGEWAIALRGAQLGLNHSKGGFTLRAFAGCGVVAGSTAAAELAETRLKFAPIRDALS